jgi:protein-disulfide isomerase
MHIRRTLVAVTIAILTCAAAQAGDITSDELKKALQENPGVLIEAIKANKKAIYELINQTAQEEQARVQKEAEEAEKKAYEDAFKNPLTPVVDDQTRIRGEKSARYTLVEYADFQCPYCAAGYQNVEELRKKHGSDLRFIFKHVPLPFHAQSMPAAQWFEAVAMQSPEKAWRFHDILFQNQDKLGVDFYRKTAGDLGIDLERCEKDAGSRVVKDHIAVDMAEAGRFGFNGTPSFLLNGVPANGAYPVEYFEEIIKRLDTPRTATAP